jgi:Zn finger protein HypA/HybF involved in hydrogenase expression
MEFTTVRVNRKELTCRTCETDFFGYSESEAESVTLYECDDCTAIFSLAKGQSVADRIRGKHCPDCDAPLEESLVEKTQAGICPMCEDRDYYGNGNMEEVELETYSL